MKRYSNAIYVITAIAAIALAALQPEEAAADLHSAAVAAQLTDVLASIDL